MVKTSPTLYLFKYFVDVRVGKGGTVRIPLTSSKVIGVAVPRGVRRHVAKIHVIQALFNTPCQSPLVVIRRMDIVFVASPSIRRNYGLTLNKP